ncbi:MAG: hypothetical protein ACE5HD_00080 [Acidobacteriota bacterium]
MLPLVTAAVLLSTWQVIRVVRPALMERIPAVIGFPLRALGTPALLLWSGRASAAGTLLLAVLLLVLRHFGTRTMGYLRREVQGQVEACERALRKEGQADSFFHTAVAVLMHRFTHRGMGQAEAISIARRCPDLDALAAQVALLQGGMMAYAAYLRRFGEMKEVADAQAAAVGDRFPGDLRRPDEWMNDTHQGDQDE